MLEQTHTLTGMSTEQLAAASLSIQDEIARLQQRHMDIDRVINERARENWIGEKKPTLAETLTTRYAEIQEEIKTTVARTPGEAAAATNYFRGRADEANHMRSEFVKNQPEIAAQVPAMDVDLIQVPCQREIGQDRARVVGIGR